MERAEERLLEDRRLRDLRHPGFVNVAGMRKAGQTSSRGACFRGGDIGQIQFHATQLSGWL